ncbi:SRPBCC family protein [Hamadaea tsunoensis]|uniref:SRPBCC family protein n=1 Tax=Hamadaea tsunoensis TaxID=53368 RepID=UPI0004021803|nr:SRPBCC family protein [Hamadaea tsunoensis]
MINEKLLAPVRRQITVPLAPAEAFELFAEGIDRWWIRGHKIGAAPLRAVVLEPRAGGRWYEIGDDGSECDWGKVLVWEPPHRLVLAWQLDADWAYDPDLVTEVEVTFAETGTRTTAVTIEHRDLDRFGATAPQVRTSLDSPNGWAGLLDAYAGVAGR